MSVKKTCAAVLCGAMLALPALAQDEPKESGAPAPSSEAAAPEAPAAEPPAAKPYPAEPPLHRWGGITLGIVGWYPQLVGAHYEVADVFSSGHWSALEMQSEARIRESLRFAYHLPKHVGSIVFTYDSMSHDDQFQSLKPGQFVYDETQSVSSFAGYANDGLADGVSSGSETKTRELRIDYSQTAFDSKRARGTWSFGYRDLDHSRSLGITYYALIPDLPPVIPPIVSGAADTARFTPQPDTVDMQSNFSGSGLGAAFDVEFRLARRVSVIGGLSVALYRGKLDTTYESRASFFFDQETGQILTNDELIAAFNQVEDPQADPPVPAGTENVFQAFDVYNRRAPGQSQFAQSFDVYLGIQVNVWRTMNVSVLMRELQYLDVAADLFDTHSIAYEGYGVGLSYRF